MGTWGYIDFLIQIVNIKYNYQKLSHQNTLKVFYRFFLFQTKPIILNPLSNYSTMCQPKSKNGQQNQNPHNWEEEAIRQQQLYPDLSEFLNTFIASGNSNSAANTGETSHQEQSQHQSTLQNILTILTSNFLSQAPNSKGNDDVSTSSPYRDSNDYTSQPTSNECPPKEPSAHPENNPSSNMNDRSSAPSAPPQEPSRIDARQCGCQHSPKIENNFGFSTGCHSRRRPQGMPWNYHYQDFCNMNNGAYNVRNIWNNIRQSSIIHPHLSHLMSTFLFGCLKASAFLTFMVALFGFLCVVPHSLMAIGLAIAVIRSITRIPILPLVAGSAFITLLLYLDSQLLMLMCVYAIFKSVVMGKSLVNRQSWRRCCQME